MKIRKLLFSAGAAFAAFGLMAAPVAAAQTVVASAEAAVEWTDAESCSAPGATATVTLNSSEATTFSLLDGYELADKVTIQPGQQGDLGFTPIAGHTYNLTVVDENGVQHGSTLSGTLDCGIDLQVQPLCGYAFSVTNPHEFRVAIGYMVENSAPINEDAQSSGGYSHYVLEAGESHFIQHEKTSEERVQVASVWVDEDTSYPLYAKPNRQPCST